jgi:hypothetical protein
MLKAALMGANARMSSIVRMGRVALVGVVVAAAIPVVSSCSKDDSEGAGVYVPPADLSTAEIVQLVKNANAEWRATQKYTVIEVRTVTENGISGTDKEEEQVDKAAKKRLRTNYIPVPAQNINNLPVNFSYIEDSKEYYFNWSINSPEDFINGTGKSYTLYNVSSEGLNEYFGEGYDFIYGLDDPSYTWTWKVENAALVGTRTYTSAYVYKYEITLDAEKRFKSVKYTYSYTDEGITETRTYDVTITYDANPTFPAGFNKADFKEDLDSGISESNASRTKRAKAFGK